jgi:LysM repeat protein
MRTIALGLLLAACLGFVSGSAHAASGNSEQKDQPQKHTVVSGESLSSIATDNNLPSWMVLWDTNTNLQNPDQINVGEVITIPNAPYPTTDRALPAGYDAPAATSVVASTPVSYTPAASTARVVGNPGGIAQRVCAGESGCNYAEDTGNGYYGAYQFDNGTWADFDGYASANLAPAAVQDQKFQQEYAVRGCSPWPNTCY